MDEPQHRDHSHLHHYHRGGVVLYLDLEASDLHLKWFLIKVSSWLMLGRED